MNNDYFTTFLEEYKVIQSKIDKIGEFKFRIKGWSITLVIGLIASVYANKVSADILLVALFLPFPFQCLEIEQDQYTIALGNRAMLLEKIMDRLTFVRDESINKKNAIDIKALAAVQGSPRTAVTLRNTSRQPFSNFLHTKLPLKSHLFYYFQYLFIIASELLYYSEKLTK